MQISTKSSDAQIPTLILFENGKEVRRLTPSSGNGHIKTVLTRVRISWLHVHFEQAAWAIAPEHTSDCPAGIVGRTVHSCAALSLLPLFLQ